MSRLDVQLLLQRTGWAPWIAGCLILAAALVEATGTLRVRAALELRSEEIMRLRQAAAAPRPAVPAEAPLLERRLQAFRAVLGDKRDMHRLVAQVFSAAERHALALAQADYKLDFDQAGGFYTYQLTLPVRGAYPQVRRFVDATLAATPCAALEEVDFRRDGIGMPTTEAKLKFVLYLKDGES